MEMDSFKQKRTQSGTCGSLPCATPPGELGTEMKYKLP